MPAKTIRKPRSAPHPKHVATVSARYPDAAIVEGNAADLKLHLARKHWPYKPEDPRASVRGFHPEEHAAQAALVARHPGDFPTVFLLKAGRYISWTTGVERDVDEPGHRTLLGMGLTPAEAWKEAAEAVARDTAVVAGDWPLKRVYNPAFAGHDAHGGLAP